MSYYDILLAKQLSGGGGGDITVESLSVTANGTYSAPSGKAYSPVVANVPNSYTASDEGKVVSSGALVAQTSQTIDTNGTYDTTLKNTVTVNVSGGGGGSNYTLLYSGEVEASTTSTSAAALTTLNIPAAWNSGQIIYMEIKDKAGPRNGYFYGTSAFFIQGTGTSSANWSMYVSSYSGDALATKVYSGSSGYGVYPTLIKDDGDIPISMRYHSSNSKTIDGTFTIKVYKLTYPS